jgi:hypothetical protein
MKKIILPTLIITTSLASLPLAHAQSLIQKAKAGIESATGAVKEAVGDEKPTSTSALDQAIEALKSDITKTMLEYDKASEPDEEKMRVFEKALTDTQKVIELTKQGGALDQAIEKAYNKNKEALEKMRAKANDTSIPAERRAKYESLMPRYEAAINQTNEKKLVLIRMSNELKKKADIIASDKEFYVDMLRVGDLEAANQSLQQTNDGLNTLIMNLDKLNQLKHDNESGPAIR